MIGAVKAVSKMATRRAWLVARFSHHPATHLIFIQDASNGIQIGEHDYET